MANAAPLRTVAEKSERWSQTWTNERPAAPDPLLPLFLDAIAQTVQRYFSEAAVEGALRSIGYRMLAQLESEGVAARGTWRESLCAVVDALACRGAAREVTLRLFDDGFELRAADLSTPVPSASGAKLSPLCALPLAAVSRAGGTIGEVHCALDAGGVFILRAAVS
ncbi:MAG TPA: hypothetical protein VM681_00520 [Candidatus Thermoplasmatota archaeon]|nr:hypothetical protein [Candidatus Thermoplasmatota archaeon]